MTHDLMHVDAREHADMGRREDRAALEDARAGDDVTAHGSHVLADTCLLDDHAVAVGARALDHHDGIGTVGHWCPGHDADRFAGPDGDGWRLSRREISDDA